MVLMLVIGLILNLSFHFTEGVSNGLTLFSDGSGLDNALIPAFGTPTLPEVGETRGLGNCQTDLEVSTVSSNSNSLLETYYRLWLPSKVPGFSEQDLVRYYFDRVCEIYSCFDADLNPFRTLVDELWSSCATIYIAIQSMAVGYVANYYPYMTKLGLTKRR